MAHNQPNPRQSLQQQRQQVLPDDERSSIPPLASDAMAIFMPIEGDSMIAPFNPPWSEVERLQNKIEDMEPHAARVKKNMKDLYKRECLRLYQEARIDERRQNGAMKDTAYPVNAQHREEELNQAIANMSAPANFRGVSTPAVCRMAPPDFGADFSVRGRSREQWTTDMERTISQGLVNLRGYDEHNRSQKERYTKMLEDEKSVAMDLD
ncbi:uncharacterized protein J7T54_003753 [Emericellopsis cladophorae]|uniref:Uncharacterized protein n=1 Tax=Emericellopsis cladophorae TaxID=2686198 RepID=A0A9P9XXT4_9HYPO|nr:uncharacterized protein J7T54_003753 [Emericellopsis cladophorae]KAI6779829.1 hypothetical protein J7T54_003753 [Emericellopsis cladophorae]